MLRFKRSFTFAWGTLLTLFVSLGVATPAQAATVDWPSDDLFVVGDAQWWFYENELAFGWDTQNRWYDDGYVYYPNEFRFAPDLTPGDPDDHYFLCGDPQTYRDDATVTLSDNGAYDIACPELPVPDYPALTSQMNIHIYPAAENGYLIRQHLVIHNDSATVVVIPDLEMFNYPNLVSGYSASPYTPATDSWFEDSTGSAFALVDGATWYSQGMLDGSAVSITNSWALTGSGVSSMYLPTPQFDDPYAGAGHRMRTSTPNAFAANGDTHLLTFTNMVLPNDRTRASASLAQQEAIGQTAEFSSFSGRLIEGLPACTAYAGWGVTPGSCDLNSGVSPNPQPCIAALAETGFNFFISLLGGLGAAAVGMWFIYQSKKPLRPERGRIRRLLFPES